MSAPWPTVTDYATGVANATRFNKALTDLIKAYIDDQNTAEFATVSNRTGSPITVGQAVYILGAHGDQVEVALADATTEATAARTFGIAAEAIPNHGTGKVCVRGVLRDLNTNALTQGQVVWLAATPGGLTTTRPTQPNHGVFMGVCVKQGPGASGILYISVVNGQELDELHDVLITTPAAGQALVRNPANTLWINGTTTAVWG